MPEHDKGENIALPPCIYRYITAAASLSTNILASCNGKSRHDLLPSVMQLQDHLHQLSA